MRVVPPRSRRGVVSEIARVVESADPDVTDPLAPTARRASHRAGSRSSPISSATPRNCCARRACTSSPAARCISCTSLPARRSIFRGGRCSPPIPRRRELQRLLIESTRRGYDAAFREWRDETARRWRAAGASYRPGGRPTKRRPTPCVVSPIRRRSARALVNELAAAVGARASRAWPPRRCSRCTFSRAAVRWPSRFPRRASFRAARFRLARARSRCRTCRCSCCASPPSPHSAPRWRARCSRRADASLASRRRRPVAECWPARPTCATALARISRAGDELIVFDSAVGTPASVLLIRSRRPTLAARCRRRSRARRGRRWLRRRSRLDRAGVGLTAVRRRDRRRDFQDS